MHYTRENLADFPFQFSRGYCHGFHGKPMSLPYAKDTDNYTQIQENNTYESGWYQGELHGSCSPKRKTA